MLKPTSDRLHYGKLLTPPAGYTLAAAVGTTYSLDLETLMGICISLGLSEEFETDIRNNPICMLEALRKTADKVAIFCEGAQIKVPSNMSALYILLEKMVFEVHLPNKKSFHPKFWLLKYQNQEKEAKYRCIILSRNLTFDRSWDVAFSIEGKECIEEDDKSIPIHDLLKYLTRYTRSNDKNANLKKKMLVGLAEEVLNVCFSIEDKKFNDFEFWPVGIPGENRSYTMEEAGLFDTYNEFLIMTPFLSASIIADINAKGLKNVEKTLITRKSELYKLKSEMVDGFTIFTLKDTIVDGESRFTEEAEEKQHQDIHAKLYLRTKYSDSELYLGSLNASQSACHGNVEFMIKLFGKRRYLNTADLKKDIFNGEVDNKDNPFEETGLPGFEQPDTDSLDALNKKIKDIARLKSTAVVEGKEDKYDVAVSFENLPPIEDVTISPLLDSKKSMPIRQVVNFTGMGLFQLSEFYIVCAAQGDERIQRVIKIKTQNMPEREKTVVGNIIKNKQDFIEYIAFILGDDYLMSLLESNSMKNCGFSNNMFSKMPALYEKMLKTAASAPERFNEIEYLLKMVDDNEIVPAGFFELYNTFKKAVGK